MEFISDVFNWLSNQLLKMQWLYDLIVLLIEDIFGLSMEDKLSESIHFFIYDTIKIFILLIILIFSISYIQSYFPPERTRKILGKVKGIKGNILGAILGTITPFCSCSSIPIFIGFTKAGLPIGVTFSFLISSPFVDLASVLLIMSIPGFGLKVAIAYVLVGLILAVVGGTIIDKLKLEKYLQDFVLEIKENSEIDEEKDDVYKLRRKDRIKYSKQQVKDIIHRVWIYILVGVGIGALIHNWIPEAFIHNVLGNKNPFSVLIAAVIAIPMYADIFGTLPIAEALFNKGIGIGTILTFMMGVTALSLPSMILLSKVVKKKLLFIFIFIVSTGIIIIGYIFNSISYLLV